MPQRVRFAPIYADNNKIAELEETSFDIQSNGEPVIITEGWDGESDGAITCKATAGAILPVAGMTVDLVDKLLKRAYVEVGMPLNGKIYRFPSRVTTFSASSQSKSGMTKGKFEFSGGAPKSTG